jgi:hypothetical protein
MSKGTYPLKLPNSVKKAAADLAKLDGVSLNQFIAAAVAEKVGTMRTASEFLQQRAGAAAPRVASHNSVTRCLTSDVTGFPLLEEDRGSEASGAVKLRSCAT